MIKNIEALSDCINGTGNITAELKFEPIRKIRLRPNVIFDIVDNKKVLHLGCTDYLEIINQKLESGFYLHKQLTRVCEKCLGIDINAEAVNFLKEKNFSNVILSDITNPNISEIINEKWDYLLISEMLEHIDDPVKFLKKIVTNYKSSIDKIIITVPNVFGLINMSNVINFGTEMVDSDHRYCFTPYTLWKVIHQAGLVVDDIKMCLYENSIGILNENVIPQLLEKPILLDTIVAVCHCDK
ncbi:MAG: methyltransferase domain-containing protein [Clostridium sp.]|nr:methyltransferase domain-containing protein [Clostridium sp.]